MFESNNKASIVLKAFKLEGKSFGLPARVRGDFGTENKDLASFMRSAQGYEGAYIQGPSVHNQRIERLHYDTTKCVLSLFINLFLFMENVFILDRTNFIDIQESRELWMSSEMVGIITPYQQQKIKLHISCGWRE